MLLHLLLLLLVLSVLGDLKRWSNDEVEVIRTAAPENGKPLIIAAKHKAKYTRNECMIWFDGQHFVIVFEGNVYDENNDIVDWIEAWDDGDKIHVE